MAAEGARVPRGRRSNEPCLFWGLVTIRGGIFVSHLRLRLLTAVAALVALAGAGNAFAAGDVVISQVYGSGGNSGATLTNDYIELHNRTLTAVSLTGWSVQYAASTGTSWQKTSLSGPIAPGGYYLVQQAAGTGGTTPLPTPECDGNDRDVG